MMSNPILTNPFATDKQVLRKFLELEQPEDKILATYVWIDGTGENLRSKTMTIDFEPTEINQLSWWNFDGSSTAQAEGSNSDVFLKPVSIFNDPFLLGKNKIVLCETYTYDKRPHRSNKRFSCQKAMEAAKGSQPWFGIEQEYCLMDIDGWPFGWPKPHGYPLPQGPYYCSVGAATSYGRDIVDAHYRACLYAGVKISGANAETMPSQWEFQVGPLEGVEAGDHLWMGRYILHRVAEEFGVAVTFDPKPVSGNWHGGGAGFNFSTKQMREDGGIKHIEDAIHKLAKRHQTHVKAYEAHRAEDAKKTPNGRENLDFITNFTWGVADRGSSCRIPRNCVEDKKGFFEDRRPASNCDPYLITDMLVRTCVLNETD